MSEHVRSWASTQELVEEFDHILTEKRVKLDNLANVDRDVVEEFLKEELCPSTPLLPKPPQIGRSNEGPENMTGSGNKEDSESSDSDSTHKEESDGILATKKEVLVTLDWDSVDGLLRETSRKDKDSESSVSIKKFLEEFNATLQKEFENKVWTYGDNMGDLPRKEVLTKKEVLVTLDWDSVDGLLRETSRKDKDSESSVSIKKFLEEFNATLQEEFENKVWTYGDNMGDLPRKEVLLPPPPPSLLLHPPALPPNVSSAFPEFGVDATVPVRHNGDPDNVSGPPVPTFLPPAPSAPPPPSIQEIMEDVTRILAENFRNVVPTDWNVREEFLPGNVLLLRPPPSPPVWLGPPQLHTDTLILHSLPIVRLPEGFKLGPIGVLNGEILYGVFPPPLNVCGRKSNFSTPSRVRDKRDVGRPYVKKPPNAFILFLKEIRPKVVSELNISRSAVVNRVVGEMWNCLAVEVKAKYFEKARLEQKLHQQQHPGWSANSNYRKKRKRVKNKTSEQQQQQQQQYSLPSTMPVPFLCLIPDSNSEPAQDHQGPKAETDSRGALF
ncbi:LOW QUALITY PROTEIN: uncharacterized protein LOC116724931 [Xiphophorus hellerii]|uniref:LOW QUALITY PROTEIN: uncharacterized protein LOC116724931 n=1 Tax=Xiphophorus hellerii TaxID=8084 RepID=UPI0013B445DE|nr:LOW QUALITY PROTEIN: uncharacterized protein LOC116724931 [Xiphophorus hellerii]